MTYKLGLQYNLQKKEIAWETVYDEYSCWTSISAILALWGFYLELSFQYLWSSLDRAYGHEAFFLGVKTILQKQNLSPVRKVWLLEIIAVNFW